MRCKPFFLAMMLLAPLAGCLPLTLFLPNPALQLYPVQGPAAQAAEKVVLSAQLTGNFSGKIHLVAGGETCVGVWGQVPKGEMDNSLAPAWDLVYGAGTYTARVLGSAWHAKGSAEGSAGTRFQLELYRDTAKGSPLLGVAKDSAGNTYKVIL